MSKVLVIEPGKYPEEREMELDCKSIQNVVGGYFESISAEPYGEDDAIIYINEEGKINGMPFNRVLMDDDNIIDLLVGPMMICRFKDGDENCSSLTQEQILHYKNLYQFPEVIDMEERISKRLPPEMYLRKARLDNLPGYSIYALPFEVAFA